MAPTVWHTSFGNEQQMESGEKQLCCEQQRSVKIPLDTRPNPLERNSQLGLAVSNMPGQPSVRHSGCVSLDSISLPLTSDHQDKHGQWITVITLCSYPLFRSKAGYQLCVLHFASHIYCAGLKQQSHLDIGHLSILLPFPQSTDCSLMLVIGLFSVTSASPTAAYSAF